MMRLVLADVNQLEMALLNLTVNARDAMPDGGQIVISAHEETIRADDAGGLKPGLYICLVVSDTGIGMDEATLMRATEPFFTTKGLGKGTGLGLSMVHGLSAQSGGRFTLERRKGEGTSAKLWLPVAETATQATGEIRRPVDEKAAPQNSLVILAVDDDSLVLSNTIAMLEDLGHTGLAALSGKEALDILRRELSVDLIITDQIMPQMTGLQLAEAIHQERPHLPVILATGYAEVGRGMGASLLKLSKPFNQDDLAGALARILPAIRGPGA
jgi:CheY-like chemotaxis protein/anti-sigma regulatory factor (Ser/Thr protein kinase)